MQDNEQVEERVEYRVVGDAREREQRITCRSLGEARGRAADRSIGGLVPAWKNVRVQKSTVTVTRTPWEDVADE